MEQLVWCLPCKKDCPYYYEHYSCSMPAEEGWHPSEGCEYYIEELKKDEY